MPSEAAFWEKFWKLSRQVKLDVAITLIEEHWRAPIYARTLDGAFRTLGAVLLPGAIVDGTGADASRKVTVDVSYHADDLKLMNSLGCRQTPRLTEEAQLCHLGVDQKGWQGRIRRQGISCLHFQRAEAIFLERCWNEGKRTPQRNLVDFCGGQLNLIHPLEPIQSLRGSTAVAFCQELLQFAPDDLEWEIGHRTRPNAYQPVKVPSLVAWALTEYGWVETSLGPWMCKEAVGPSMGKWAEFLPVAKCSEENAKLLQLIASESELTATHLNSALTHSLIFTGDVCDLTNFYALAAGKVDAPESIRCLVGSEWTVVVRETVTITSDADTCREWRAANHAWLHSPDESVCQILREKWNLLAETPKPIGFDPANDPEQVIHRFPSFKGMKEFPQALQLQPCARLWIETLDDEAVVIQREIDSALRKECLYYLENLDTDDWLLGEILKMFPGIAADQRATIRHESNRARLDQLLEKIRKASSIEDKLLVTFGEERLRSRIPERHLTWLDSQPDLSAIKVAQLAHACLGAGVLKEYRDDLESLGLNPPGWWNGAPKTIAFVEGVGFPGAYAGSAESSRDPFVDTIGPATLKDLLRYQEQMRDKIVDSLNAPQPQRGMLSLPTGAGKTRVAVQSLIEWFKSKKFKVRGTPGSVLWIAGSDELCEQAVRCWQQAWRVFGPVNQDVRINRLWGSTNNRIRRPDSHVASVVVATEQSLVNRLERDELNWVFAPDVIVIDEAHHGTATTYTRILKRLV